MKKTFPVVLSLLLLLILFAGWLAIVGAAISVAFTVSFTSGVAGAFLFNLFIAAISSRK
ncbi:hypothetical protein [Streptomyces smyrnaeus]|uniref:hypothetical protein n=1 Tax=Streptomyces smyrnaeus TaxID=1387713 RepID=UPI003673A03D